MTRPRRILYIDHTAVLGGGEIALLHLIRNLNRARFTPFAALLSNGPLAADLTAAGAHTFLIDAGRALIDAKKDNLRPLRTAAISSAALTILRIARLINELEIDLVHCNSLKADILGGLAARLTRRPVIWHVRDRIAADYLSRPTAHFFRAAAAIIPTHTIANSNATRQTLHLPDPDRASVIYSGLDLDSVLQIPQRPFAPNPRIAIIGRLAPWKGQHIFLQAAAQIARQFPTARFQIVGGPLFSETDYQSALHKQAESLGIAPITEFTGHRPDIPSLLAEMDIVVHASTTPEPFGQVAVLAMAAAKPLIATAAGGILEIVENKKTGLLVPMNDAPAMAAAIAYLLSHPAAAAQLARAARRRAQAHFTIAQTAQQVMDVYDRLNR